MKICLNTWALYNNGIINCEWFDIEDYQDAIDQITELQEENGLGDDCEIFVADTDDDVLNIGTESCNLEEVASIYERYESLYDSEADALKYLIDVQSYNIEEALDAIDDVQVYDYDNFEDLAYEFVEEGLFGKISDTIKGYLDYEVIGRDLSFDYDLYDGKIYRIN